MTELETLFAEAQAYVDEHGGAVADIVRQAKAKLGRLGNMLVTERDDILRGWGRYQGDTYTVRYTTSNNDGIHEFEVGADELVWDTLETLWNKYGDV